VSANSLKRGCGRLAAIVSEDKFVEVDLELGLAHSVVRQFPQQVLDRNVQRRVPRMRRECHPGCRTVHSCFTSWNEGAARIKGYSACEIVGKHHRLYPRS
jgi:hypothetical protein